MEMKSIALKEKNEEKEEEKEKQSKKILVFYWNLNRYLKINLF
jgi:hypothetical protein